VENAGARAKSQSRWLGAKTRARHVAFEQKQYQTQTSRAGTRTISMTTEIPQKFWEPLCNGLKDWHRGAISIRWIQPGGDMRLVADNIPLQTMTFEKNNRACSDTMTVEAGPPNERPLQHRIIEPFRVVFRKNDESGRYNEMEILAETGKTEILFSPGIDSANVENLAA
jgi:hypothetical protein